MNIADIEKFISTLDLMCFIFDSENSEIVVNKNIEDHERLFNEISRLINKLREHNIKFELDETKCVISIL